MFKTVVSLLERAKGLWWLAAGLLRRPVGSLRNNPGLGLLALALSAGLWVLVTMEQNPPKTDTLGIDIPVAPVNVPDNLAVSGQISSVHVRITAPLDSWPRLAAASFRATADLSEAKPGEQKVPVRVRSMDREVRVLEVIPPEVRVQLEALKEQKVPVKVSLQNALPFGYTLGSYRFSPEQVAVFGPERLVDQVDEAVAYVNLEGMKVNINQSFPLTPRTARGYEVEGVRLAPSSVVVEVSISQQLQYQSFSVVPQLRGSAALGYWVGGVFVQPSSVTVVGTQETLQALSYVRTMPIDVSGVTSNIVRSVGLDLPKGVSVVGADNVVVSISVLPSKGTRTFWVAPKIKGLSGGMEVISSTDVVGITLSGEMPTLSKLSPTEITITVDVTHLSPGAYSLEPEVKVPPGLEVVAVEPNRARVVIRETR